MTKQHQEHELCIRTLIPSKFDRWRKEASQQEIFYLWFYIYELPNVLQK